MISKCNRWVFACFGFLILLSSGVAYSWSTLSLPIAAEFPGWTKFELSLTFSFTMLFFCISGMLSGKLLGCGVKPRTLIILASACNIAGFIVASNASTPMHLYISIGLLIGFSGGFSYNPVLSPLSKWFADRQGFISGFLLMGMGFSSFLIGKIFQAITPYFENTWRTSFLIMGTVISVIFTISSLFIVLPKPEQIPAAPKRQSSSVDFDTRQMIRKPAFFLYFIWAVLISAVGMIIIGQASGIMIEVAPEVAPSFRATIVGLISVANGVGRIFFGRFYDKKGYRPTMLLAIIGFFITSAILISAIAGGQLTLLVLGFILGGLCYSCVTPTNSALTNDFFGSKYYAMNFPLISSCLMIGSFGSSISGALYDASQSYISTLILSIVFTAVSLVALLFLRKPEK